jgi:hypothetical protein
MAQNKPRIIKDFEKLDVALQEQIKLLYPKGFSDHLISFTNREGKLVSALPFETDDHYYLVKMTAYEAQQIVDDDKDYDEDGVLKDDVREDYEDKYSDLDYLKDNLADEE